MYQVHMVQEDQFGHLGGKWPREADLPNVGQPREAKPEPLPDLRTAFWTHAGMVPLVHSGTFRSRTGLFHAEIP
jgi:hypothetical protein